MNTLNVDLGTRSYPIYIGNNLLREAALFSPHIKSQQVLIVTNETVAPLYLETLEETLSDYQIENVILPDGEQYKTLATLNLIFDQLLLKQLSRQVTIIALGGGVIGDMAGFAAACYQRGVPFIQVPTTLLAQVDSSVGGKTAVNHELGKNMIGAFYQPESVIADTDTLKTLDDRQFSAGLAEVIKYGLINDAEFFQWLEQHMDQLIVRDSAILAQAIERSCQDKATIVADDEREQGVRALLNLGHTFGHAIETGLGYGTYLHGEAIAVGMLMAADMSRRLGWLQDDQVARIRQILLAAKLPVTVSPVLPPSRFIDLMSVDKKVQDGKIRLILLRDIGQAVIEQDYDLELLNATLEAFSE